MVQVHGLLEEEVSSVDPKPYKMVKEFYHSCMNQPIIEVKLNTQYHLKFQNLSSGYEASTPAKNDL